MSKKEHHRVREERAKVTLHTLESDLLVFFDATLSNYHSYLLFLNFNNDAYYNKKMMITNMVRSKFEAWSLDTAAICETTPVLKIKNKNIFEKVKGSLL